MSEQLTAGQEPAAAPQGQEPSSADPKAFDADYVHKLREEAATYRRKAKELEAEVTTYRQAQMTEAEKLKAEADAAKAQAQATQQALRQARLEAAVSKAAVKAGVDAELLNRLVGSEVQYNDAGEPSNVDELAARLVTQYPQLRPVQAVLASTNPQRTAALTLDDIRRMTPQEIMARQAEVDAALRASRGK